MRRRAAAMGRVPVVGLVLGAPLLAALAKPSRRGGPASCLDHGEMPPAIWLVDAAGQAVNVQWPLDSCGHPLPGTAAAPAALTAAPAHKLPAKDATPTLETSP